MRYLGGHLDVAVTALLDGQLDPASAERAWAHVRACALCDGRVRHEGWVKTQLAAMTGDAGPPPQLLGSLYGLASPAAGSQTGAPLGAGAGPSPANASDEASAWAAVRQIEQGERGRRRTGLVLAGAGSVSAAVLGLATLTGSTLGIGAPSGAPTSALTGARTPAPTEAPTAVIAPLARVHGRIAVDDRRSGQLGPDRSAGPRRGEGTTGLMR